MTDPSQNRRSRAPYIAAGVILIVALAVAVIVSRSTPRRFERWTSPPIVAGGRSVNIEIPAGWKVRGNLPNPLLGDGVKMGEVIIDPPEPRFWQRLLFVKSEYNISQIAIGLTRIKPEDEEFFPEKWKEPDLVINLDSEIKIPINLIGTTSEIADHRAHVLIGLTYRRMNPDEFKATARRIRGSIQLK